MEKFGISRKKEKKMKRRAELEAGSSSGRGGPPPHLKGREIGLFYARRNRQRRNEEGEKRPRIVRPVGSIYMDERVIENISVDLDEGKKILKSLLPEGEKFEPEGVTNFKISFLKNIHGSIQEKMDDTHCEMMQHSYTDEKFYDEFQMKKQSHVYREMLERRKTLPSYNMKDEVLKMIEENQVVVISGDTGCGKTTQVAQFILDDYIEKKKGSICRIICTQPRRISAVSVADRVAKERDENIGRSVGYHIRLDTKLPRDKGSITFCTTGIVLKEMEADPCLTDVSHLILDEVHERDNMIDFLMALLKKVITKRKDLKIILMSATLNSESFSRYFNNCKMCKIPGIAFPVEEFYLEDVLERTGFIYSKNLKFKGNLRVQDWFTSEDYKNYIEPYIRQLETEKLYSRNTCLQLNHPQTEVLCLELIVELVQEICKTDNTNAAILVFLPGYADISSLNKLLEESGLYPPRRYLIIPLHSQLPTTEQRAVFERPPKGVRKIIISTNIAETSITIDDVVYVIDCGKIKIKNFDTENNVETLSAEWVSQANALQRKGRAGRVRAGCCFHLFSRVRYQLLEKFQKPEILRSRLDHVILQLKILQLGKAEEFLSSLLDVPDQKQIQLSLELLTRLNALDCDEKLTPLGYHLAKLPVSPQMGKLLLLGALFGCLDPVTSVAASLDFRDAFQLPLGKEREVDRVKAMLSNGQASDHLTLHEAVKQFEASYNQKKFCWDHYLSYNTMNMLIHMKKQFVEYLHEMSFVPDKDPKSEFSNVNSNNLGLVKALICAGLYPNVGILKKRGRASFLVLLMNGMMAKFHPKSILQSNMHFSSKLIVYYQKVKSSSDYIHDATVVNNTPVVFFGDKLSYNEETRLLNVCDNINLRCDQNVAMLMARMRDQLNAFLEYKVANPGYVDWANFSDEAKVLWPILELITNEDQEDCVEVKEEN